MAVLRSSSREIAGHVKDRLVNYLVAQGVVLASDSVQITIAHPTTVPHWHADREFLIWPRDVFGRQEYFQGGGRHDTRATRQVAVAVRTRLELDQAGFDPIRLTDSSQGHLLMEAYVLDALQEFMPTDDGEPEGDALVDAPLAWRHTEGPNNDPEPDRSWVYSILYFDLEYQEDLDVDEENFGDLIPEE